MRRGDGQSFSTVIVHRRIPRRNTKHIVKTMILEDQMAR